MELVGICQGSGCGSVGRAVASNTRDPRLESSHWRYFKDNTFTVKYTKYKKIKEAQNDPFLKKENKSDESFIVKY